MRCPVPSWKPTYVAGDTVDVAADEVVGRRKSSNASAGEVGGRGGVLVEVFQGVGGGDVK